MKHVNYLPILALAGIVLSSKPGFVYTPGGALPPGRSNPVPYTGPTPLPYIPGTYTGPTPMSNPVGSTLGGSTMGSSTDNTSGSGVGSSKVTQTPGVNIPLPPTADQLKAAGVPPEQAQTYADFGQADYNYAAGNITYSERERAELQVEIMNGYGDPGVLQALSDYMASHPGLTRAEATAAMGL